MWRPAFYYRRDAAASLTARGDFAYPWLHQGWIRISPGLYAVRLCGVGSAREAGGMGMKTLTIWAHRFMEAVFDPALRVPLIFSALQSRHSN
jgi:hypothetical protein